MTQWSLAAGARTAAQALTADLTDRFGPRLISLVAYGRWVQPSERTGARPDVNTPLYALALVSQLAFDDLSACADRTESWDRLGLATPLLLTREEFVSSLDAFPVEFGDIIDRHVTLAGRDPFDGARVRHEDLRRACEVQAKSHLIHLREGFLEAGGRDVDVEQLIRYSIASFGTLLANLARLQGTDGTSVEALARFAETRLDVSGGLVRRLLTIAEPIPPDEALRLYPPYHDATASIAVGVDRWKGPGTA